MSYPLTIQSLVVEDQEPAKEMYEQIFETLGKELSWLPFQIAPPLFAFSYQRAREFVDGSKIFHLVILDLRLPENDRVAQCERVDFGQALVGEFLERERFPIPALLVISGHIDKTEQDNLQNRVRNGFYHGRVFVKQNYELIQSEIKKACVAALQYCAVGVHLRDAPGRSFPTLSPREDDLLRRSVLQQPGAIGLDVSWWDASPEPGEHRDAAPWKKILLGRYLFADGVGPSRPRFFKFMPRTGAENVVLGARRLEQKLYHIKVLSEVLGAKRALIVTEKVGASEERPISLEAFLARSECSASDISSIAEQISGQLEALGDLQPASKALKRIFWPHHDRTALKGQWDRFQGPEIAVDFGANPACVEEVLGLMESSEILRFDQRSCSHGDLNISNVALDLRDVHTPDAYIFDAGNNTREIAGKDIAVLEVSALLHQSHISEAELVQICKFLYGGELIPEEKEVGHISPPSLNTLRLILQLRKGIGQTIASYLYALLVLDYAATQLEGLRFSSGNKIRNPSSAVVVFVAASAWCIRQEIRSTAKA